MSEVKKKFARGEAFIVFEGTVGKPPVVNTIDTKNGKMDVASIRAVASPYRIGQKEPEDIWFTIKFAGQQCKYVATLNVGDFIAVRGGFSTREYTGKNGAGLELVINADTGPNAIRRLISKEKAENGQADGDPVEVLASVAEEVPTVNLFG